MLFTLSNVNSSSILLPLLEVQGPFEHTYNHSVYLLPQLLPLYCEHLPFEYVHHCFVGEEKGCFLDKQRNRVV